MDILETLDREGLTLASNNKRFSAFIIDDIVVALIIFIAFYNQISEFNGDVAKIIHLMSNIFIYIVCFRIIYHSFFTAIYGASIGKIICKIKIIKVDTLDKPNILESIIRSVFRIISSEFLLYIPFIFILSDKFRRGLHDMLINSIVIDVSIPQDLQD
ncbi:RDD family protein [Helicobacter sp. MIT 14-3879]|uniref:RDD family protein n=1 Tax=Helicobacter sp. MIT 14-3879 TaxID=2040649 RepID=UPI000E1E42CB|nr:RDD family protein [Helicobacter sp. MIT 14-3879]RDU64143.1 hypothetical protein CQA44_04245 [Helicobacter sp. MIT 14-3879]